VLRSELLNGHPATRSETADVELAQRLGVRQSVVHVPPRLQRGNRVLSSKSINLVNLLTSR
jgi:hypothetical protein